MLPIELQYIDVAHGNHSKIICQAKFWGWRRNGPLLKLNPSF